MQAEDPLFRRSDHEKGIEFNNRDHVLLKPEFFILLLKVCTINSIHDSLINNDLLLQEIKKVLLTNKTTKNYQELPKTGLHKFKKSLEKWNLKNGLLLFCGYIYILKDRNENLQRYIVQIHHNLLLAEHPNRWKTYELVLCNYWWPDISVFVKKIHSKLWYMSAHEEPSTAAIQPFNVQQGI